jgi:uncharacterized protein
MYLSFKSVNSDISYCSTIHRMNKHWNNGKSLALMKDGIYKKNIKRIAWSRYCFDLAVTRLILKAKGESNYKMQGKCCKCGACCETPMIRTIAPFFYLKSLRWLFLIWHRKINGFELIREDRIKRTFVFNCTHFNTKTKQCDAYSSRPGMCRDYPINILYNTPPLFLPTCTFSAIAKNADQITESLDKLDLPPEKLEKIKKEFFVE